MRRYISFECVSTTLSLTAVTIVTEEDLTFRGFLVQAQNQNGNTLEHLLKAIVMTSNFLTVFRQIKLPG